MWYIINGMTLVWSDTNEGTMILVSLDAACFDALTLPTVTVINSSPLGQNGCHFANDNFRCIFVNEKFRILIKIALKFVPQGPIDNISALVSIMAWRQIGDKPLSKPILTRFTDAYMRHLGGWVKNVHNDCLYLDLTTDDYLYPQVIWIKSFPHWSRVTHICVDNLTIIDSDNGLSPGRSQAIIWTSARMLLIGPLVTNFGEIVFKIRIFSLKKMHLKTSSVKWRPFCLSHNV